MFGKMGEIVDCSELANCFAIMFASCMFVQFSKFSDNK